MSDSAKPGETSAKPSETSSRWWEFYAVRYAMGTVVGAIALYCLYFLCQDIPIPIPQFFDTAVASNAPGPPRSGTIRLDASQLALLAICGLVYCYIASAPILVFHAGRFLLKRDWVKWRVAVLVGVVLVAGIISGVLGACCLVPKLGLVECWCYWIVVGMAVVVLLLQYVVALVALFISTSMFAFYKELAEKREHRRGEIVDSYRHLREHGNAFFIVLMELLLGVLLVATSVLARASSSMNGRVLFYLGVLIIWILPAVLVWVIGTLLEREFSRTWNAT